MNTVYDTGNDTYTTYKTFPPTNTYSTADNDNTFMQTEISSQIWIVWLIQILNFIGSLHVCVMVIVLCYSVVSTSLGIYFNVWRVFIIILTVGFVITF